MQNNIKWESHFFLGNWCFTDYLDKPVDFKDVKIREWVMVTTRAKRFMGKVLGKKKGEMKVCCLGKL